VEVPLLLSSCPYRLSYVPQIIQDLKRTSHDCQPTGFKVKVVLRQTVSQPVCFGVKPPIWGPTPDLYYCNTVMYFMCGTLSDERMGLSFTIAAGPCQRNHSWFRVLRAHDHILLSQIRDSPNLSVSELFLYWRFAVNQFVLATSPLRLTTSIFFQLNIFGYSLYVTSSLTRGLVCCLQLLLASPAQSFSGLSPAGLMIIFYCLRFETPPTWWARSSYLYPPGTGWRSWRHRFQQILYCCVLIRCRGIVFSIALPGNEEIFSRHVLILLSVLYLRFHAASDIFLPMLRVTCFFVSPLWLISLFPF
jgi:hypothetical protein